MAMQNEDNDVKANRDQQSMGDGTGSDDNTTRKPAEGEDDQQAAMPPSETDDDQYDQGTVQREP